MDQYINSHATSMEQAGQEAVGCFVAGTLVHTQVGLRPIEHIKVGDYVLSKPEDGSGETAYKRVVNTFEFEDKETWFISWEDMTLLQQLWDGKLTQQQYLDACGNSFVVTTPNHPFWVVSSDGEVLSYDESGIDLGPPFPQRQWIRADHVAPGMTLMLPDGREVHVLHSKRVYNSDKGGKGWVGLERDMARGLEINFENHELIPHVAIHSWRFAENKYVFEGLVENKNESFADDWPPGSAPYSWYRSKVYNLEVEDFHTYFVDSMGVWVHNS